MPRRADKPTHPPGVAHEYAASDAALVADHGGLDGARLIALGQDNALMGAAGAFYQHVPERGRAEPPFLEGGQ